MTVQRIEGEHGPFEIYVAAHADALTFTFDVTVPLAQITPIAEGGPVDVCQNPTRDELVEHVRQCQAALGTTGETGDGREEWRIRMSDGRTFGRGSTREEAEAHVLSTDREQFGPLAVEKRMVYETPWREVPVR
jgi:hypothetical protein